MAKKIRFPLKMANGTDVRTLEELRTNFDLTAILGYYADGKLLTWLRDRFYDSEADKIEALDKDSKSFQSDLCAALGVAASAEGEEADGGELDMDYINRRNEKRRILREITDDEQIIYNVDSVALNQDDLLDLYDEGKKTIYLCKGEFEIPLSVTDVTYIGVSDPIVTVRATDNVNFKEKNIKFDNLFYGWDISSTTPNDELRRAENLFMNGDCKKAAEILKDLVESGNPRAIMLAYRIYKDFLYDDEKLKYYEAKAKQSQEIFNVIDRTEGSTEKYFPLLKKLADKGDAMSEYFYAWALDKEEDYQEHKEPYNAKEMFEYYRKNSKNTVEYYCRSADKGNVLAMISSHECSSDDECEYDAHIIEWYTKDAANGNLEAQCELARCYGLGYYVERDRQKSFELYKEAAELGYARAQHQLADEYSWGISVKRDLEKTFEWETKAANQGYIWAQISLGIDYYLGSRGLEKNYEKAAELFMKVVKNGDNEDRRLAEVQEMLGNCYFSGEGVEKDLKKAAKLYELANKHDRWGTSLLLADCYHEIEPSKYVEWLIKSAEHGIPNAQIRIGNAYYKGDLFEQNYDKAIEWYEKAAIGESVEARYKLANCYCNELINYEKALEWYITARISKDDHVAKNYLPKFDDLVYGHSLEENYRHIFDWFYGAANDDDPEAQLRLGDCYYYGITADEEKDYDMAVEWYTKAAEQGNTEAMYKLAECYNNGDGVDEDIDLAIEWYTKAAQNGNVAAMTSLCEIYEDDDEYEDDFIKWCTKAYEQGDEDAWFKLCDYYRDNEDNDILLQIVTKAAELGIEGAAISMGECYSKGLVGVEIDLNKALKYYYLAAEQGEDVSRELKEIALEMD